MKIILSILVAIALAIGGLYFSGIIGTTHKVSEVSTVGWVEYSDNTLGVVIKHPDDWNAHTSPLAEARIIIVPNITTNMGRVTIWHEEGSPEDVLANGAGSRDYIKFNKNVIKDISIDGRKTILRDIPNFYNLGRVVTYVVDSGNGSYVMSYSIGKNTDKSFEAIADTIIRTAHFDTDVLAKDPWVSKDSQLIKVGNYISDISHAVSVALYGQEGSYLLACLNNKINYKLKTKNSRYINFFIMQDDSGTFVSEPYNKSCVSQEKSFAADFIFNNRMVCVSYQGNDFRSEYVGYGHVDPVNKVCIPE